MPLRPALQHALAEGPLPLARLRIAVALMLGWVLWQTSPALADQPVVHHPVGAGWLAPVTVGQAALARGVALLGVLLGGLGIWPRLGFFLATVGGVITLGVPQLRAQVLHTHHLLWLSALLAASPCGDALALTGPTDRPGRSVAHGLPVRIAWLLIALIFFFPGLQKVMSQGIAWADAPLRHQLWWKWAQSWSFTPPLRIDRWPRLLQAGGLAVLALELGFPLAICWRPTRGLWALGAVVFHALTQLFLAIPFAALWCCYVIFLPGRARDAPTEGPWHLSAIVGSLLLTGVIAAGITGTTQGWPFACYPTFHQDPGPWMPTATISAVMPDGTAHPIPLTELVSPAHSQRFYAEAWVITGRYGPVPASAQTDWLHRLARRQQHTPLLQNAHMLQLHDAEQSVHPDHPQIRTRSLLLETPNPFHAHP